MRTDSLVSINPIMLKHFVTTVNIRTQTLESTAQEYLYDSTRDA